MAANEEIHGLSVDLDENRRTAVGIDKNGDFCFRWANGVVVSETTLHEDAAVWTAILILKNLPPEKIIQALAAAGCLLTNVKKEGGGNCIPDNSSNS